MTDVVQEELSRVDTLLDKGKYEDALKIIDNILDTTPHIEIILDARILKSEVCWRAGKLEEGLKNIEETERLLDSKQVASARDDEEFKKKMATHYSHAGILYWYSGDLETATQYHKRGLKINEAIVNVEGISIAYNNLGLVYWSKGNLDIATEYYEKSLKLYEDRKDERGISRVLNNLANISANAGELDKGLKYHQRSLSIKERIAGKQDIAQSLINIGVIYRLKGNFTQAAEYYNRSLAIQENLSIGPEFALALNNLGEIYNLTGELETALEFYQRSFLIYEDMGNKEGIALTLANIGDIHTRRGEQDIAFEYYLRSLNISEEMGNRRLITTNLSELVSLALDLKDTKLVEDLMTRFTQVNEESDSSTIDQRYRVTSALILKKKKRMRDRISAAEIFDQVIEEDITDHTVTVSAMVHLCDLLLDELKATGEEDTLNRIKELTQRLVEIAREQTSPTLLVETYLLQSKLAIIAFEFIQAQELMVKAQSLADEKGLQRLAVTVENEIKLLQYQKKKWESVLDERPSTQEIIDVTNLNELLERMVHKTVETLGIDATPKKIESKYELFHKDSIPDVDVKERSSFRVGIAQIGLSQNGNILNELYEEKMDGLIGLKDDSIELTKIKMREMVSRAQSEGVNILIFPEMSIDLGYKELLDEVKNLAKQNEMIITPGSYHNVETKRNLCLIIGPEGILWEQEKHIPAIIHIDGKRFIEKIETSTGSKKTVISGTEYGRIAITICRDFLDMDLRVELKNSNPPVDLIINPAFTPVTADFNAAHFDARRSIYAYCFFANIAEFGNSLIYSPERDRTERTLPSGKEGLLVKDVNLFQLRSERKKWDKQQREQKSFIQSTRT